MGSIECRSMGVTNSSAILELIVVLYENGVLEIETKGKHSPTGPCGLPLPPCRSSPGYRDPCTCPAGRGFPPPTTAAPPQWAKALQPQGSSWSLETPKEKTENRAPSLGLAATRSEGCRTCRRSVWTGLPAGGGVEQSSHHPRSAHHLGCQETEYT